MKTARIQPWQTAYVLVEPTPDDRASERFAAAQFGTVVGAKWFGIPTPSIQWFREVGWRGGYDFAADGRSNGFTSSDKPSVIHLNLGSTPAEVCHSSFHEGAHLCQLAEGGVNAWNARDAEREADACARVLCERERNSCNRCQLSGNPPLDFRALLRARETVRPAVKTPAATAGTSPRPGADVTFSIGHLSRAHLYAVLSQAEGMGATVRMSDGKVYDAAAILAAYEKAARKAEDKPAAKRTTAPTAWPSYRTLRPSTFALRHAGELFS